MTARTDQGPLWPSYADLMTSLFCVMLVLFAICYALLLRYQMNAQKWAKMKEIEQSVSQLADGSTFVYQPEFKRHVLREEVRFNVQDATIDPRYEAGLKSAGERIVRLVRELKQKSQADIKYLIVIEGMSSKDTKDTYADNFGLSYRRALALYQLWTGKLGIRFDPSICEVIIAGSGTEGVGRYPPSEEAKNQRFLIQVIPKVGEGWSAEPAAQAVTSPPVHRPVRGNTSRARD